MTKSKYSLVTAIVQKNVTSTVLDSELKSGCHSIITIQARGTLVRDSWVQSLLPAIHPEQDVLQMLVPNNNVNSIIAHIVQSGGLHLSGSGAIYSSPCVDTFSLNGFKEQSLTKQDSIVKLSKDLVAIYCIVQKDKAERISSAIIKAGGPSATIFYGHGRGIRDRMGLVRIAINPEKELMSIIVNSCDANHLFNVMVESGHLDRPGEGFIYMIPVENGLMNIATVFTNERHSATTQQIIKAIDELKGNSDWRAQEMINAYINPDAGNQLKQRKYLTDLIRLTCVTDRGNSGPFIEKAFELGAPGASISYGENIPEKDIQSDSKIPIVQEKELIEMTLSKEITTTVIKEMKNVAKLNKSESFTLYTHKVPKALTYLP